MINTIVTLIREILQMTFLLIILGMVIKLFLRHTLLGKIIAVILKDIYLLLRGSLKITVSSSKYMYKTGKTINKYVHKKIANRNKTKNTTTQSVKKVVNGNNVIDFKSAKQLRHKWYK